MTYHVFVWDNAGTRTEYGAGFRSLSHAELAAKLCRTVANRTVKIGDAFGDSIRHWARHALKTQPNKWVRHSTAECSR